MDDTKQGISNEAFELESEGNHITDSKTLPDTQTALFDNNLPSFHDSYTKTVDKCLRDDSDEPKTNDRTDEDTSVNIKTEHLEDKLDSTDDLIHNADRVLIVEVNLDRDVRKQGIEERQDAGKEFITTKDSEENNKRHDCFNKEDSKEFVNNNNGNNDGLKFILKPVEHFKEYNEENVSVTMENENVDIAEQADIFKETTSKEEAGEIFCYKFTGPLFRSLNDKSAKKSWRRRSLGEELKSMILKESTPELNRSQYSLVSCGELTPGAVQLWLGLPEEVRYDPALAQFRQLYEKEHGKENIQLKSNNGSAKTHRLPMVSSAPHLNNNVHVYGENVAFISKDGGKIPEKDEQILNNEAGHNKETKIARAQHLIKMTLLVACWLFFTVAFLMYNEKEQVYRHSSAAPGELKSYILNSSDSKLSLLVKLSGPFLSEQAQGKLNSTDLMSAQKMEVWLERRTSKDGDRSQFEEGEKPNPWTIILQNEGLDFSEGETRSNTLRIEHNSTEPNSVFALRMRTTSNETTPFSLNYTQNPLDPKTGVIYAFLLLCGLYVLIIFEVINRTMAAVLLSTTALATLSLAGERPSVPEIISWLDVETLLLLFSMMILVAIMAETGMFDFLAVYTFEVTKGKLWPLITLLSAITAVLSTFLDNVTTVLLMTPVTIRLCEVMNLDPIPILMSMVLYSNIGGTATPVGDPPNVIIASNKAVIQAGINFTNFTLHMTLGILLVSVQTYVQLRYMFRDTNKLRVMVPREIQDLRHQISIWRRAADSMPQLSKDQMVVRERLERKVRKLSLQLETMVKESNKRACPKDTFQSTLAELKDKYKIRDKVLLVKATVAIAFVVALFFLHSIPELNRVSLGWTALLGAILLLVLADREDLEPILHRVEWSTLLFFAALFVFMEALSKLGLIEFIGGITESIVLKVDESARLAVALLLMLWVSGLTSAFVDNIPLTTMMVRVVTSLGSKPNLNLPMAPLIWALSFGACLGGNGTLIGASANVVCAGVAEQHGYKFTFVQFFKIGFPIMIGHLVVASVYLMVCHCAFTWH